MKNIYTAKKWQLIGVLLGSILGYFYYRFIGCSAGTCKITSNPIVSTLYGGLMGYLLIDMLVDLFLRIRTKK
jgi:urea transporter